MAATFVRFFGTFYSSRVTSERAMLLETRRILLVVMMNSLLRSISLAVALIFSLAASAGAQVPDACADGASSVGGAGCVVEVEAVELEPAPAVAPAVASAPTVVAGQQQLPVTGGDATSLALVGGGLLAAGAALTLRARRNTVSV